MSGLEYFQSYQNYFWQWEEEGEVLAIPNGNTIAYRDYVLQLLEYLAVQDIPRFGSLLLALIAINPTDDLDGIEGLVNRLLGEEDLQNIYDVNVPYSPAKVCTDALAFLRTLQALPTIYKRGTCTHLLQTIFERCHNRIAKDEAKKIIEGFKNKHYSQEAMLTRKPLSSAIFYRDFRPLALLHERYPTTQSIIEAMSALPNIGEELLFEDEVIQPDRQKDFVEELCQNYQTFHIGSLIKRIWSGLNIPLHNTMPSSQPLGGVSDISNKGDFDKLLISEFANEDIVFMSRLANSEALYLRREIPPQTNSMERIILIDVTLKNWGNPKLIGYALALAIEQHPKTDISCSIFALGNSFTPLDLSSVDAVINALNVTDSNLNPLQGLGKFFREYPSAQNAEVFVISSSEVVQTAAMQKAANDYHTQIRYWLELTHEGSIDVWRNKNLSRKHLQHIQLPLDELWRKEPAAQKVELATTERHPLPASRYPLGFPLNASYKHLIAVESRKSQQQPSGHIDIFVISSQRSLLHTTLKKSTTSLSSHLQGTAVELVVENLPVTHGQFEIGTLPNGDLMLLCFQTDQRKITLININSGERHITFFHAWKSWYSHFYFYEGAFRINALNKAWTVHPASASEPTPQIEEHKELPPAWKIAHENRSNFSLQFRNQSLAFSSVLRHVESVFINLQGYLVVNKHELFPRFDNYHDSLYFRLVQKNSLSDSVQIAARKNGKNTFLFPDGSSIDVHPDGMLTLISSKKSLPPMYIPLALEHNMGMATTHCFAGIASYQLAALSQQQKVISVQEFFDSFINQFIQTILHHGTTT